MEQMQVNNVYKIKDKEVNYFEVMGKKVQFDEIFELMVDLDENDRNYSKMKAIYPDGRQPIITTIQKIYDGMMEGKWEGRNPQLPEVKGYNSYIDKNSIRMSKGIYVPKVLLFLADELNELMTSDDYKSVDTVKQALGSIARLGRAAAVHLALACQRASGSTISTDLKNNIQMSVLLGGFDDGASQLMFEKDISQLAKPQIKGRGFIGSGNEIIETQTYYTQPENDWMFDEDQKLSYNNPVFIELCKRQGKNFDELNNGWVPQHKIGEEPEEEEEIEEDDELDDDIDEDGEDELFENTKESTKEDSNDEEISTNESKNESIKVESPEISMDDLEALFGPVSSNIPENFSPEVPTEESTTSESTESVGSSSSELSGIGLGQSNRDRISSAIDSSIPGVKPKIKLNIDKTASNKPSGSSKIKLNIK